MWIKVYGPLKMFFTQSQEYKFIVCLVIVKQRLNSLIFLDLFWNEVMTIKTTQCKYLFSNFFLSALNLLLSMYVHLSNKFFSYKIKLKELLKFGIEIRHDVLCYVWNFRLDLISAIHRRLLNVIFQNLWM